MEHSAKELEYIVDYDYYIINDDLDKAAERLAVIINAERCRVARADLNALQELWQRRQNGDDL